MEQIEGMILDDLETELGYRATGYHRYSDQCAARFKVSSNEYKCHIIDYYIVSELFHSMQCPVWPCMALLPAGPW